MVNKPKWVVFHSVKLTTKNYLQTITAVEGEWLLDIAPMYYDMSNFPEGGAAHHPKKGNGGARSAPKWFPEPQEKTHVVGTLFVGDSNCAAFFVNGFWAVCGFGHF